MALLCFLTLFIGGLSCVAQEQVEIFPKSEVADSVYLQPTPGRLIELKLNQVNQVEGELLNTPDSMVVFRKKGYLDRLVPVEPIFLESGFPGDFTNLERYYNLKLVPEPTVLKVYEVGRSSDKPGQKNYLGSTGGPPLRLDRLPYFDSSRGKFSKVRLLFEAEGYEPYNLELSSKELVPTKELGKVSLEGKSGFMNLWKRSSAKVLGFGFLGILGAFAAGLGFAKRKRNIFVVGPTVEKIGAYEKLDSVGKGGTAEVFRARAEDGLEVALKLMMNSEMDEESKDRFRREIKASMRLQHPNLAEIYDWGEMEDGRLYLVSELLKGETLSDRLKNLEVGEARDALIPDVLGEVGKALTYLHDEGVVHRDLKPANIFLTEHSGPKLIDLGLARGTELDGLTRTGVAIGTPHYMSPEQAGGNYTAQSDQYALGVIAFEILTGTRPFTGSEPMVVFHQHLSAPIPNLADHRPGVSIHLSSVVSKMLSKKPDQRFPSLKEAVEALTTEFRKPDGDDEDTQAFIL